MQKLLIYLLPYYTHTRYTHTGKHTPRNIEEDGLVWGGL
jgi:hypothetical protein